MKPRRDQEPTVAAHLPLEKAPAKVPDKIGPYKVDAFFAKGGMSYLYLATHPVTKKPLIIKVLPQSYITFPHLVKKFLKESKIIALVDHPHIVKLYDQGSWQGGLFIAMEMIHGISLKKIITQSAFSKPKSVQILLQIASAISHLHAHGIIHRDLKPENILIDDSGMAKVIDFGIAVMHEEKIDVEKLEGTALYMAPEQREKKPLDFRCDIYALGMIAYELILGKPSFGMVQLALIPKPLRPILAKALAADRNDRYPDIVDFIADLKKYLQKKSDVQDNPEMIIESLLKEQKALSHLPVDSQFYEMSVSSMDHSHGSLFFDWHNIEEDNVFMIASATEPHLHNIMNLSHLSGYYKALLPTHYKEPYSLLEKLDRFIRMQMPEVHFSIVIGKINPNQGEMELCSLGSIFIHKENASLETLSRPQPPLGMVDFSDVGKISAHFWENETLTFTMTPSVYDKKGLERMEKKIEQKIEQHKNHSIQNRSESLSQALFETSSWQETQPFIFSLRKTV